MKETKTEFARIGLVILSMVVSGILYAVKIQSLELWPYEKKARILFVAALLLLLTFIIIINTKRNVKFYVTGMECAITMLLLSGTVYVPENYLFKLPILLPITLMTVWFMESGGYLALTILSGGLYLVGLCEAEQVIVIFAVGTMMIVLTKQCENKTFFALSFLFLILAGSTIHAIYQYMMTEKIDFWMLVKTLPAFVITLIPMYGRKAYHFWIRKLAGRKIREINAEDYFLFEKLLEKDEKTYYHSLEVSDLAVKAARKLGADTELVMAGARYHEIGRLLGEDYVTKGMLLMKQYRFPGIVKEIVLVHNGKNGLPHSKEAAIVMFADTIISTLNKLEERTFVKNPDKIVASIIDLRVNHGVFNEMTFSMREYLDFKQAFTSEYQQGKRV